MSRANNNGWDFIKVGGEYQYKEDWLIASIKIIEDNSNEREYRFKAQAIEATDDMGDGIFTFSQAKDIDGYWSGMVQVYEQDEYMVKEYKWRLNSDKNDKPSVATEAK